MISDRRVAIHSTVGPWYPQFNCSWLNPQIQKVTVLSLSSHYTILYKGLEHLDFGNLWSLLEPIPCRVPGMTLSTFIHSQVNGIIATLSLLYIIIEQTGTCVLNSVSFFLFFGLFAIFLGRSHGIWRFPG